MAGTGILPLTRQQMINAVGRLGGDIPRVPLGWAKFYNRETISKYGDSLQSLSDTVVDDFVSLRYVAPGNTGAPEGTPPEYRWAIEPDRGDLTEQGFTSRLVVSSTDLIDPFIERMPDPSDPRYFAAAADAAVASPDRYLLAWDFFCLFERSWFLFGMENIMCEMLVNPRRMRRLLAAFTSYHKRVMDQYAQLGAQGYFTSDDLAGQTALLFSEACFRDLYLPFYEELVDHCHSCGMHFWFHTDGAIEPIIDDLVAIGVDTLHPVQDPPMDLADLSRRYGGRITFHAGIDIQYLLPGGTSEEVAAGTRRLIDLCDREEGGCLLAASNGIMPETPLENIEAFMRTAESYGREKRLRW
jgi:uroporphyrinogen decarboxylase